MDNIIINLQICEEEIQSFTESNYDRELTEIELFRLKEYWWDCEEAEWERTQFMATCIEDAMNNKNSRWSSVDKEYKEKQNKKE